MYIHETIIYDCLASLIKASVTSIVHPCNMFHPNLTLISISDMYF